MTTALVILIVMAVAAYALHRSAARQPDPWVPYTGSGTAEDRDRDRVQADLDALTGADPVTPRPRHRRHPARRVRPRAA